MSNQERKDNLPAIVQTCERDFTTLARVHNVPSFTFAAESSFAIQALNNNEYLRGVAFGNLDSLKNAIINAASIGLTLNPLSELAYLVPRDKKVCLDISYKGRIDIAVRAGAIVWAKPVLVHDNDEFEYQGVGKEPIHKFNPLRPDARGAVIGGYCIAKTPAGDLLVNFMPLIDIYKSRDRSDAWKAFQLKKIRSTPWHSDEQEMMKKTLIRISSKTWPRSKGSELLDKANRIMDETEGIDVEHPPLQLDASDANRKATGLEIIREFLTALDKTEPSFIEHCCRTYGRTIETLDDLTPIDIDQAVTFLEGMVEGQKKKFERLEAEKLAKAKGAARENAG